MIVFLFIFPCFIFANLFGDHVAETLTLAEVVSEVGQHLPQVVVVDVRPLPVVVGSHVAAEVTDKQLFGKSLVRCKIVVPCQHPVDLLVVDLHDAPAAGECKTFISSVLLIVRQILELAASGAAFDPFREIIRDGEWNGLIAFAAFVRLVQCHLDFMAEKMRHQSLYFHIVKFCGRYSSISIVAYWIG